MDQIREAASVAWRWAKLIVSNSIGISLTAMFAGVLILVIFILSALQFKETIQDSTITNPKPNAGNVRQGVATLDGSYGRSIALNGRRDDIEKEIVNVNEQRRELDDKLTVLQQKVYTFVRTRISAFTDPVLSAIQFPVTDDPNANNYLKIREEYGTYYAQAIKAINSNSDIHFREFSKRQLNQITYDVNQVLSNYDEMLAKDSSLFFQAQDLDKNALSTLDQKLRGEAELSKLRSPEFRDLCEELLTYKALFGNFAYEMIFMPKASLTLMLAVVMGLLGSLIFLARERVIDHTELGFTVILFRASLGGALAVAIYVFAAAGMTALGQHPSNTESGTELSPYLISFMGITAGYLSEHMAAWMAQIGRQAFKIDGVEGKDRWAPRLVSQMAAHTSAEVANVLNVPVAQVDDWAALKRAVPAETQALLAVFLNQDTMDVFTDIPPRAMRTP